MLSEGSGIGFEVGQRVLNVRKEEEKKQSGTVKYIGSVEGYDGLWIGVDWDSGHGRHDGTVNGKRYFETTTQESGSLVRPHSLSAGVTLAEALTERYNGSATNTSAREEGMYVLSVRHRRMNVELVGKDQIEEKQKRMEELKVVVLAHSGVRSAGPRGEVAGLAPSIEELDLTGNLLPDWKAVGDVCEELPLLRFLNLSYSRIALGANGIISGLAKIHTLVLNNAHITWRQVEKLKLSLKSLEELHLSGNHIKAIEVDEESAHASFVQGFETLRVLNLEDNDIEDWEEVMKLSKLMRLEHLNLNQNKLERVTYPVSEDLSHKDKEEESVPFRNLRCLLLGKNKISSMDSVNALNKFPSLKDARLSENPLVDPDLGTATRYVLVARIGGITSFNGSEVKPRERKEAEIRYVWNVLKTITGKISDSVLRVHPRLMELITKYDISIESAQPRSARAFSKMSETLISVNLMCVSVPMKNRVYITRNLPPSTTVGRLKQVCEGLFRVKAANQVLYIKDEERPLPILLDNDLESISDIGVTEDSRILVDEAKEAKFGGESEQPIRGGHNNFQERIKSCESVELGQILEDIKKQLGDVGVCTSRTMANDTDLCVDVFHTKGLIHRLLDCG